MNNEPQPSMELEVFVIMLFTALVGCATGVLAYSAWGNQPEEALLAGGMAAGMAFRWAWKLLR